MISLLVSWLRRAQRWWRRINLCPEIVYINRFFDGELLPHEADRVRAHLAGCGQCQEELAFLMRLHAAERE